MNKFNSDIFRKYDKENLIDKNDLDQIELDINHPIYKWNDLESQVVPYTQTSRYALRAERANAVGIADRAYSDEDYNSIVDTYATKTELNTAIGNINSALDAINGEVV